MRYSSIALLVVLLPIAVACGAHGSTENAATTEQRALSIERGLACPQCTDLPLDVCDQDICNDMRTVLLQKIASGESDKTIRDYFVQRYGTRVLLTPPKNSSTWIAWMTPFVGLLAGAVATVAFLRSAARRRQDRQAVENRTNLPPELRARIEGELRDFE